MMPNDNPKTRIGDYIDHIILGVPKEVFKMYIEDVADFDLTQFVDRKDDEEYMNKFYLICDNYNIIEEAFYCDEGNLKFNFDLDKYVEVVNKLKANNSLSYIKYGSYINDHSKDLFNIAKVNYRHIWKGDRHGAIVKYPYNLINYVLFRDQIPSTIEEIYFDYKFDPNNQKFKNGLSTLTDLEREVIEQRFEKYYNINNISRKHEIPETDVYQIIRTATIKIKSAFDI